MSRFELLPTQLQRIQKTLDWLKARVEAISTGAGQIRHTGGGETTVGVPRTHTHQGTGEGGGTLAPTIFRFPTATELTIDSGEVTRTHNFHLIDTEGDAASDDLVLITGGAVGDWLIILPANAARTVVVKHGVGGHEIFMADGQDIELTEALDLLMLIKTAGPWLVLGRSTLQAEQHTHQSVIGGSALYGHHTYSFLPDAAKGADVTTGDQQGKLHVSGEAAETVVFALVQAEVAPTGQAMIVELEYASSATDDDYHLLHKVTGWTTIDTVSLPDGDKGYMDESPASATIPGGRRLIRMNVDQVGSGAAGQDASVDLRVRRLLDTS